MAGCFFAIGVIFFIIGLVNLFAPNPGGNPGGSQGGSQSAVRQPLSPIRSGRAARQPGGRPARARAMAGPTAPAAGASDNPFSSPPSGGNMAPQALSNIQVGQRIRVRHPQQGELTLYVMGSVLYQELWQTSRGPQSPWVPTGNNFAGFWLETDRLLLNWQNRYYLLDERIALGDAEIARDFAPHARKFAQSDQTAEVLFAYPPGMWRMVDIGKFRIARVEGEGLRMQPGAVGRFIHAHGSGSIAERALLLEDYEGAGQDAAWLGVILQPEDINNG